MLSLSFVCSDGEGGFKSWYTAIRVRVLSGTVAEKILIHGHKTREGQGGIQLMLGIMN